MREGDGALGACERVHRHVVVQACRVGCIFERIVLLELEVICVVHVLTVDARAEHREDARGEGCVGSGRSPETREEPCNEAMLPK